MSLSVPKPAIVFLTGAAGSGKTAIVTELRAEGGSRVYLHFDSIGVPDRATMVRDFGSGERWQAEMTRRWIAKIVAEHPASSLVVIEGQARPSFVQAALSEHRVERSSVVLVDCEDAVRGARLRARGQPELASEEMRSWAAFLRREAQATGLVVIDTTRMSVAEGAATVRGVVGGLLVGTVGGAV